MLIELTHPTRSIARVTALLSLLPPYMSRTPAPTSRGAFATAVQPSNFPPFPQILIEEIEHLAVLAGAADKHKQKQLHQPSEACSGYAAARRRS